MLGDFLVRRSASSESEILVINDYGNTANLSITYVEGPQPVKYANRLFATLDHAIAYAASRPLKSHTRKDQSFRLGCPAPRAAWFKGDMVREDCESVVLKGRTGDFLVRKSGSGKAYTIVINDDGALLCFAIQPTDDRQFEIGGKVYDSLEDVVDAMRNKSIAGKQVRKLKICCVPPNV